MGIFDRLFNRRTHQWSSLASNKSMRCANCGMSPLLTYSEVDIGRLFYPSAYTDTINVRAVECPNCGKFVCVECLQKFAKQLDNGERRCQFCGSRLNLL